MHQIRSMMAATDWLGAGARIGDYVVEFELLAKPGLVAWSAAHTILPRRARLSTVQHSLAGVPALAAQLTREACLLEALRHPGVPRVFECGVLSDGRPWVASELVEGPTLADILSEEGRLGVPLVLSLLAEVAEILHHVHARGLVHRNLRPEVIMRKAEGPSIIDWGDARGQDEGMLAHVPQDWAAYQPPEVIGGEPADSRADVFALGVVACEALAGVRTARATAHRFPAAPERLTALLDRMLARDSVARPTSAEVRAEALSILEVLEVELPPPLDDGADVQIEDVELGAGLASEAEADAEPPPPPPMPPRAPSGRWMPSDFSQRARTKTMPAVDFELSSTRTRTMPAMEALEAEGPATKTKRMSAVLPAEAAAAAGATKRMPAVEPDLEQAQAHAHAHARTKTEPMIESEPHPGARTKTEPMVADDEQPGARPPARPGKVQLPTRILERNRTKAP